MKMRLAFYLLSGNGAGRDYVGWFRELLPSGEYADANSLFDMLSAENIFRKISDEAASAFTELLPTLSLLFALTVILSLASLYRGRGCEAVLSGIGIITSLSAYGGVSAAFFEVSRSMQDISGFFASAIPLFSAVNLAGGGAYTSAGQSLGMAVTVSLFSRVITPIFTAAVGAMLALGLLDALGVDFSARISSSIKKTLMSVISATSAILLGTIALQTVLSSAGDNAAMRAAKHLTQTMLPVVGPAVSASLSALWGGLSLTKGVIGVGGICVIVGMLSAPLVSLLIYRFFLGILSWLSDILGVKSPISRAADCLDLLIGVYAISSVIYVFEIVLFIKGGVELL